MLDDVAPLNLSGTAFRTLFDPGSDLAQVSVIS
jgi:hypothetical protein